MGWSKCSLWAREIIAPTPALEEVVGWKYECENVLNPASFPHCFWMAGKGDSETVPQTRSTTAKKAATIHLLLKLKQQYRMYLMSTKSKIFLCIQNV